ncbi:MAG TPA: contractile injection system protein, VgrG/Pvc8 family, partial [Pseudolabrys sp.]|nr:contractile injection system protein, VgrG/Pvc8 family [Pseudolabrys sp.]
DARFQPFATLAVVAQQEDQPDQCVFDGVVLSSKLHLTTGAVGSELQVWGQDASWLMNLEDKVKEWVDVTDADVANAIFSDYGITPADDNSSDDSPSHTESGHSLMQRATDIQFLRQLARRNGKLCRVACDDKPGERIGYFVKPALDGDPVVTLTLNDSTAATVSALDFEWDVARPSAVQANQALFTDPSEDGASGDTSDSGLAPLDERTLADFAGQTITTRLTAPVDDAGELMLRAQALLRESGWFARCEGETDAGRLKSVLRAGTVVQVDGAGSLNSGKYFVWSVRHSFTPDAHKMRFTLVRNAVGPPPAGGGGLLGGLV